MRAMLLSILLLLPGAAAAQTQTQLQAPDRPLPPLTDLPQFQPDPEGGAIGPFRVSLALSRDGEPVAVNSPGSDGVTHLRAPQDGAYFLVVESTLIQGRLEVAELEVRVVMEGGGAVDLPACSQCANPEEPFALTLAEGDVAQVRVTSLIVTGTRIQEELERRRRQTSPLKPLS